MTTGKEVASTFNSVAELKFKVSGFEKEVADSVLYKNFLREVTLGDFDFFKVRLLVFLLKSRVLIL